MLVKGFLDLSYLEGTEAKMVHGYSNLTGLDDTCYPDRVEILKDYGKTILVNLVYVDDLWVVNMPPRKIRRMINKGAMLCGDVVLKDYMGNLLIGHSVGNYA